MGEKEIDRYSITFEQAEGYEPIEKGPYKLKHLSKHTRSVLWGLIHSAISDEFSEYTNQLQPPWRRVLEFYWVDRLHHPVDEFSPYRSSVVALLKQTIMEDSYEKTLGFLQFILRLNQGFSDLGKAISAVMDRTVSGYALLLHPTPTFVPRSSEQEIETIRKAFKNTSESQLLGAQSHLQQAVDLLSQGEWAGSIRESIHAVESVAKVLSGKESADLSAALKVIDQKSPLHGALREALIKLYGYTSDEKGIRHALIDESRVTAEDAQFMLSACAGFVSYLTSKHRKLGH
jgi:hypothetical protein